MLEMSSSWACDNFLPLQQATSRQRMTDCQIDATVVIILLILCIIQIRVPAQLTTAAVCCVVLKAPKKKYYNYQTHNSAALFALPTMPNIGMVCALCVQVCYVVSAVV